MDTASIIAEIDAELARFIRVRHVLTGHDGGFVAPRSVSKPKPKSKRRPMSAEAREKIAAAQRKRWAKQNSGAKKAAAPAPKKSAPKKAAKKPAKKEAPKADAPAAS